MVTHREIKQLEEIQITLQGIKEGKLDLDSLDTIIKSLDNLMVLYWEAYILTGLNSADSWGRRDEENQYLSNNRKQRFLAQQAQENLAKANPFLQTEK
jgi:hypothetical protein